MSNNKCLHIIKTLRDGNWVCRECNTPVECKSKEGYPSVVTTNNKMSFLDKCRYWGIKNPITGEGVTKKTKIDEPIGITTKNKKE